MCEHCPTAWDSIEDWETPLFVASYWIEEISQTDYK